MIYFVLGGQFVKIGHTDTPKTRFNEIQVGCPYKLELLGSCAGGREEEVMFHELALPYHYRAEWFRYKGELKAWLKGADNVVTMNHGDGYLDYCFRSEIGGEKALEDWMRSTGRDYTPPSYEPGPIIRRGLQLADLGSLSTV